MKENWCCNLIRLRTHSLSVVTPILSVQVHNDVRENSSNAAIKYCVFKYMYRLLQYYF